MRREEKKFLYFLVVNQWVKEHAYTRQGIVKTNLRNVTTLGVELNSIFV
jgi:hypothetical protein